MFENKTRNKIHKKNRISSIKKASWFFIRGSMTVEATVVLPLFLFFFINLSASIEMIRLHSNMSLALWNIGNDFSIYGALTTDCMRNLGTTGHNGEDSGAGNAIGSEEYSGELWSGSNNTSYASNNTEVAVRENNVGTTIVQELGDLVVSYTYIKNRIIEYLGDDYLNNSPLAEGADSIQFFDSEIFTSNDTIVIITTYQVKPLIDLGDSFTMRMSNTYYSHLWNGYNVEGNSSEDQTSRIVYITEDSEVYHTSTSCTYLRLAVRLCEYGLLGNERNRDGGRYYPCMFCVRSGHPAYVYLCDDGSKYHYSRNCLGLRRRFSVVSLSSVQDTHRPCSRCGGY